MQYRPLYIIDAIRTGIGRLYGRLSTHRPDDLGACVVTALLDRQPHLPPKAIAGLYLGCANQAGEDSRNLARQVALLAGLPAEVYASTVNALCASGMEAVVQAARAMICGEGEVYLAGGLESMSRSPWVEHRLTGERADSTLGWRFTHPQLPYPPLSMTETAELLARDQGLRREAQDAYSERSRRLYQQACAQGAWREEILALPLPEDEQARLLPLSTLAKLPPVLSGGQHVTLGNSARGGDGAALLLLASETAVQKYQLRPLARLRAWASAAVHPSQMGLSPVPAVQRLLREQGLSVGHIEQWSLSESFAAQVLADVRLLDLDLERVNPLGGSIAMGNPTGMGGARLLSSLVHGLRHLQQQHGVAATCAGLGLGWALWIEKC